MTLSYYCRGREYDIGGGEDKKDSSDRLVSTHFRRLGDVVS